MQELEKYICFLRSESKLVDFRIAPRHYLSSLNYFHHRHEIW